MELRRTFALSASALVLAAACGESHMTEPDAAIVFDATFPDTGTDSGPPPSNVGASCAIDEDCMGPADMCIGELGGYCSAICSSDADCPAGSACVNLGTMVCLDLCNSDTPDDQCADGLGCIGGGPVPPVCLPGCEGDAECGEGLTCVLGGGAFGAGACIDPDAPLGAACTSDADCPPSGTCATGADYPGGTCVIAAVCDADTNVGCPDDAQCLPGGFGGDICWDGCTTDADCRSGWECADSVSAPGRLTCQPIFGADNLGQECVEGPCPGGDCLTEQLYGFPGSYCADFGCDPAATTDSGCPNGGICAPTSDGVGICLLGCTADTDCRTGYRCVPADRENPDRGSACRPGCTEDSQCTARLRDGTPYECNPGTGLCARPFDVTELGEPCAGDFRQCRGGLCLTGDASGWPAGMCVFPGCRLTGTGPSATCPAGSVCTDDGAGDPELGVCVDACTVGGTDCRPGYACVALTDGGTDGACRPACDASSCVGGTTCNTETGLCE